MQGEVAQRGGLEPQRGENDILEDRWPRGRARAWMGQEGVQAAGGAMCKVGAQAGCSCSGGLAWKHVLQHNRAMICKSLKVVIVKEKWRNCPRLKKTKEK